MKDGEYIHYFISGEISYKCNYLGGERHGEFIRYFITGEIEYKCWYLDGKSVTESECISYNRNIKLVLLGL